MTTIDPAAVHADPDGGIRWDLNTGEVLRADPVISVSNSELWRLYWSTRNGQRDQGEPALTIRDGLPLPMSLTRWTFTNAEHLYRVHSYDPDTDCYLLVWPD